MPWSEPLLKLVLFFAVAVLSALITVWACWHANRHGLLDQPGERRSHTAPTPRGGGISIVLICLCACLWLAHEYGALWLWVAAGLLLVAMVGWWDDHTPVRASLRLLVHCISGGLLALGLALNGAAPSMVVAGLVLVPVLVNAWNFMDGINGLATTQALLAGLGLFWVLAEPWQLLALALVAGCLGFLPFNLVRARIFLGDVGSGALGYLIAALVAAGLTGKTPFTWPLLLLPACAFLVDSGMTLGWRIVRGETWWQPHVQHLYQRMARSQGHLIVTAVYAGWTVLAVTSMLILLQSPTAVAAGGFSVVLAVAILMWWRLHGRPAWNTEGTE